MKKLIIIIIAVLLMMVPVLPVSAQTLDDGSRRVFDDAGLMSESEISELEEIISGLRNAYNMDFVVLTSDDAPAGQSTAFADDFYDYNGFGSGAEWDGFLFFIDMNNRVPTISTCGLMIRYVTDPRLNALLDTAYEYLVQEQYANAAAMTLRQLEGFITEGIPSDQYNADEYGNTDYYNSDYDTEPVRQLTGGEFLIALAAGLVAALIMYASVSAKYGLKGSTYNYNLSHNTEMQITDATDVYLRTNVVKVLKQRSVSSGSGGSRSSTHSSSSGRSHGGGSGRRF